MRRWGEIVAAFKRKDSTMTTQRPDEEPEEVEPEEEELPEEEEETRS